MFEIYRGEGLRWVQIFTSHGGRFMLRTVEVERKVCHAQRKGKKFDVIEAYKIHNACKEVRVLLNNFSYHFPI